MLCGTLSRDFVCPSQLMKRKSGSHRCRSHSGDDSVATGI